MRESRRLAQSGAVGVAPDGPATTLWKAFGPVMNKSFREARFRMARRWLPLLAVAATVAVAVAPRVAGQAAPAAPPESIPGPAVPISKLFKQTRVEAEKGNPAAQFKLGMLCAAGKECPQDLTQAAEWLRKAADQGIAAAQFNLAVFYAQGVGLAQDYAQAAQWFRKAAEQSDRAAQYNLGVLYATGAGVARDLG